METKKRQIEVSTLLLQTITSICVSDIQGIKQISPRLLTKVYSLLQQEQRQSVIIQLDKEGMVTLDIFIAVAYDTSIPDACLRLQKHIKHEIEVMTGYKVKAVRVHVGGVYRS
ncbi:putative alkaline shock family protein YloU [Bacillus tianshenii]|uniref:Alkaline shock family protein YloU n=1 Tax=Sutcliffiella tianshenii TaxID=1463404 RepID=A0ABS2P4C5_9BACI|nr:Asp23/Gls24 family envelope stress response protein [Bacillus tianshenii]MBM7621724.1 putative alkaline shock family protein YloU [Bacillus tianshenii]